MALIEVLKWRDSHKALRSNSMNVTAASISAYYPNHKRLSKLLSKFRDLDASQVAELMDMLEAIILENNGRKEEAALLLDYFKAEYLE